jgi:polyhydroxyalkanoate synthesis regulator protein
MELFQQTFSMFKPFAARNAAPEAEAGKTPEPAQEETNIDELRRQMKDMQDRLDRMSKKEE